jgi:hypothetical protein
MNEPEWAEAIVKHWYRRLYRETGTGQMMVLRPDRPKLHHYGGCRWHGSEHAVPLQNILTLLSKIHSLLWVLIAVVIITVLLLRR